MSECFQVDIVSAEAEIYSGPAKKLFVTGAMGELEILVNHAPFFTWLEPGPVWITKENDEQEALVIFGGMLEVQPKVTTVLADAALHARDIDEQMALDAKEKAEHSFRDHGEGFDYSAAHTQLAEAVAQLRVLQKIRSITKK